MNSYLFFLGQNSSLAEAELSALLPGQTFTPITPSLLRLDVDSPLDLPRFANRLGGTVKVAHLVTSSSAKTLATDLAAFIAAQSTKNFSLFSPNIPEFGLDFAPKVKKLLQSQGHSARFVKPTKHSLSPVIIRTQNLTELTVLDNFDVFHTTWVHDFRLWIDRDRNKPYITPKGGMLPPKLARILVNLALGDQDPQETTLLDPFCGTGTVLIEAALMGTTVIGADLSADKVDGSRQNLDWLPQQHYLATPAKPYRLISADATNISQSLSDTQITAIATEPTLGPTSPQINKIKNISHGLQKLYLGALKDWQKILPTHARVVITLPVFRLKDSSIYTSDFIDARENLGYNVLRKDLFFTRPGALIERQVIVLEKNH